MKKLKGYKMVLFNAFMMIAMVIKTMNPDAELPDAEQMKQGIDSFYLLLGSVWTVGNMFLRAITDSPIFNRDKSNQKGCARVEVKLWMGCVCLVGVFVFASLMGCASQYPECVKDYEPEAIITKLAIKYEQCPQNWGDGILIVSALSINLDNTLPGKAVAYAEDLVKWIQAPKFSVDGVEIPLTPAALREYIIQHAAKYPGVLELVEINNEFLDKLMEYKVIDVFTEKKVTDYLEQKFIPRMRLYEDAVKAFMREAK